MKKGIIAIIAAAAGAAAGAAGSNYLSSKELELQKKKVDKFKGYYNLLNQWLLLKNENKKISDYIINNNFKEIAIYGLGELGNRLLEDLNHSDVIVKYAIDKKAGGTYSEVMVYSPEDELDKVDAIIVTAVFDFEEIEKDLSKVADCPIISLEEVVYSI